MENDWLPPVAGAALALTGTVGIAWRFRARALKRWLTALDGYAEREIAQERREPTRKRGRAISTASGVSVKGSVSATDPGQLSTRKAPSRPRELRSS